MPKSNTHSHVNAMKAEMVHFGGFRLSTMSETVCSAIEMEQRAEATLPTAIMDPCAVQAVISLGLVLSAGP